MLIVFSVLLALALDAWREGRAHEREARAAQSEIVAEMRANRLLVEDAGQYHATLIDSLADLQRSAGRPTIRLFTRGFISPAQLSHTAWASAAETGALSHMDYPTVLRLSRVYSMQDRYEEQTRSIGQLLYSELYRGGTESIVQNSGNLAGIISTFRYREDQLLDLLDETLSSLPGPSQP